MKLLTNFLNRKKAVVMISSGGVGEFLFQLDLAKRLEIEGVQTFFFIKKKYTFFSQIVQLSDFKEIKLYRLENNMFFGLLRYIYILLKKSVILINSFNSTRFSIFTKFLYLIIIFTGGKVIVCKKDLNSKSVFETIYYKENEMIWERNNRIVIHLTGKEIKQSFPILFPDTRRNVSVSYIHIHPVGALAVKSYPVKKLIELFSINKDINWMLTITPSEAKWYITEELKYYLEKNNHVTLIVKNFNASEIISIMTASKVFCTVNTGLLWLAIMNKVNTVVIDTFTDYEWNPIPYENITRLSHDYDEEGKSLHLVSRNHEDGTFFESMYLVSPEEITNVLLKYV